jgi:hypothetical protein
VFFSPAARIAPITEIPEMAFEPDINGVCNVGGILLMTSKPIKEAKTSTNKAGSNACVMLILDLRGFAQRRKGAETQRKDLHNKRKISLKLFFLRVLRFFVVHSIYI